MTISLEEHVAREREALAKGRMAKWLGYPYGSTWESIAPEERAHWLESVSDVDAQSAAPIRESERAACEAIAREEEVANHSVNGTAAAQRIRARIAERKGKGEGPKP